MAKSVNAHGQELSFPARDLCGEIGSGADLEFGEHVEQMGFDGRDADEERGGDLSVRESLRDQLGDATLARRKALPADEGPPALAAPAPGIVGCFRE